MSKPSRSIAASVTSAQPHLLEITIKERGATLTRFLPTHHTEDANVRTAIVDYLVGLSGR